MIWNQLMTSPDALRKRCALALSEFFVVSLSGLDFAWRSHGIAAWWDLLVAHAFGNFRQLLEAVTLNPAMGYYLNTKGNLKENTATGRQPDENYAREVMQLFTIGLYQLNLDGTEKRGGQEGGRIETYSQSDVTNLARVFTGYDVDMSQNVNTYDAVLNRNIPNTTAARLPMVLNASRHSTLAATFLGANVPANTPGAAALKTALDTLFNHPNVGPFFGRQMIQRLVTSNPSPSLRCTRWSGVQQQRLGRARRPQGRLVGDPARRGGAQSRRPDPEPASDACASPCCAGAVGPHLRHHLGAGQLEDWRPQQHSQPARPKPAALALGVQLFPSRLRAAFDRTGHQQGRGAGVPDRQRKHRRRLPELPAGRGPQRHLRQCAGSAQRWQQCQQRLRHHRRLHRRTRAGADATALVGGCPCCCAPTSSPPAPRR
jgi:hypothetical protein